MKYLSTIIRSILRHVTLILALSFLTFHILDWYNPMMAFTTNATSSVLLVIFCVTAALSSILESAAHAKQLDRRRVSGPLRH